MSSLLARCSIADRHIDFVGTLLCIAFAFAVNPAAAQTDAKLSPSDVVYYSLMAMEEKPSTTTPRPIDQFYARLQTENLDEHQRFVLGEVYFLNFKPRESEAAFKPFMAGDGLRARIAWQRVMQIRYAAYDQVEEVENMIDEYRQRFPPIPEDIHHIDWQIGNLAQYYQERGDYQKVVDLITKAVEELPLNAPYRSFRLPAIFIKSYEETNQLDKAQEVIDRIEVAMDLNLIEYLQHHVDDVVLYNPPMYQRGTYYRMEEGLQGAVFASDYPSPDLRVHQYHLINHELEFAQWRLQAESQP